MSAATPTRTTDSARAASRLAVPLLGFLAALQVSDPNIANTAFLGAKRGLQMSVGQATLALSISTLALSATVISTGLLADRLGRRKVLVSALLLTVIGDLVVALAPGTTIFLVGRAVAGVGLGAVFGASFAYIRAVVPATGIPGAMGVYAATTGLASLVLTFVGGPLATLNWRLAFVVIPAMSLLAIPAPLALLPAQKANKAGKQDLIGQFLLAFGVIAFLYGISQISRSFSGFGTLGPLLAGVLLLAGFFVYEARNSNRFFPVSLFREPLFVAAVFIGMVYNFGNALGFLQLANLWQYITELNTFEVSLWQLPMLLSGIVAALIFGRLMSHGMSNRTAVLVGAVSMAMGFGYLALSHSSRTIWGFLFGVILLGVGIIVMSLPYGNLIIGQAPKQYFGPVTSSRTTIGQFFYSIGLAVGAIIVDRITDGGTVARLIRAGVPPTETGAALDAVTAYASRSTAPTTSLGKAALSDAIVSYGSGFALAMGVGAVVSLVGGLVAAWLLRKGNDAHGVVRDDPVHTVA